MNIPMLLCAVVDGTSKDLDRMLQINPAYPSYITHAHLDTTKPLISAIYDSDIAEPNVREEVVHLRAVEFENILVGKVGRCSCGQIIIQLPK